MDLSRSGLWIHDNLARRPPEQNLQAIEDIAPKDALAPNKIHMQSAGQLPTIDLNKDLKPDGWRTPARDAADASRSALGQVELNPLTIDPGQGARIRARIGNDTIQHNALATARRSKFHRDERQRFTRIGRIVRKGSATNAARLVFPSHTGNEGMQRDLLGSVCDFDRAPA
jgi:hypothetical protein